MGILKAWLSRIFYLKAISIYIILWIIIGFLRYDSLPNYPILFFQLYLLFAVVIFSSVYSCVNIRKTLLLVFLFQLICGLSLRIFNFYYYNNALGFEPIDAASYDELGKEMNLSYFEFIAAQLINNRSFQIDDIGFPSIIYIVYSLFGSWGREAMVVFNSIAITISSYYLYKTSLLFFDRRISIFLCFFWGIEAFAVYTSSVGLKENFFVATVVATMYYLCKLQNDANIKYYFLFTLFTLGTLLFRIAVFYAFLIAFLVVILLKYNYIRNNMWFFAFLIIIIAVLNSKPIITMIAEQRGYEYENITLNQDVKGGGFIEWVTNIIAAFLGPFPSFVSDEYKRNYITIYSFSPYCKMIYSFFYLYGIYHAIKNKLTIFFPIIVILVLNAFMIIFTLYALHDRYQWPHIPCTLIMSALGFVALKESRMQLLIGPYFALVITLIFLYNLRV